NDLPPAGTPTPEYLPTPSTGSIQFFDNSGQNLVVTRLIQDPTTGQLVSSTQWLYTFAGTCGGAAPTDTPAMTPTTTATPTPATTTNPANASVTYGANGVAVSASVAASNSATVSSGTVTFVVTDQSNNVIGAATSAPVNSGLATSTYALPPG